MQTIQASQNIVRGKLQVVMGFMQVSHMATGMNKGASLTRETRCMNAISTHPFKARFAFVNRSPFEVDHWLIER